MPEGPLGQVAGEPDVAFYPGRDTGAAQFAQHRLGQHAAAGRRQLHAHVHVGDPDAVELDDRIMLLGGEGALQVGGGTLGERPQPTPVASHLCGSTITESASATAAKAGRSMGEAAAISP